MRRRARVILAAWLAGVAGCAAVVAGANFSNDLSAFLPRSPSAEQRLLVEQLRDGVVSRLILVALQGGEETGLAQASRRMAAALRGNAAFLSVENGERAAMSRDLEFVWRHRYLLSPQVSAERFSAAGLRDSLESQLQRLASPAGMVTSRALPADPTGEALAIAAELEGVAAPSTRQGVWFSPDGKRALLVARTVAPGSDTDSQARAVEAIRAAFSASGARAELLLSGPGVFSVVARERIKGDAWRLSLVATTLIAAMLLALYRSPRVIALGLLPVASGALAGIAAVALGFASVHGITLGFGVTLIGEGVDYAIYLFMQKPASADPQAGFARIWPTLRLGMLTSVCGFAAMLLSGFTGLAQLGLFSIVGLLVAVAVTRWVLPPLTPAQFSVAAALAIAPRVRALVRAAPRARLAVIAAVALAAGFLLSQGAQLWSGDLSSLSPVSPAEQRLDQQLRNDLGAPDVRHLVLVRGATEEAALRAAERTGEALHRAMAQGALAGFDSPALLLPSRRSQLARQAALPPPDALERNLAQAMTGLPFRAGAFAPFEKDVAAARVMAPLDRSRLQGSAIALKVDSLLVAQGEGAWTAMLPLRGVTDPQAVARQVAALGEPGVTVLDLKRESDALYRSYLHEALRNSLGGTLAIVALLLAGLRSLRRVVDVLAPLAAAVVVTAGLMALQGPLSIFHLIGLLLVVAVGSNYALFFDSLPVDEAERSRTVVSLVFAAGSTVLGFGILGFSRVPVLHALGCTVGIGAVLALLAAAAFSRHARAL